MNLPVFAFWLIFAVLSGCVVWIEAKKVAEWFATKQWLIENAARVNMSPAFLVGSAVMATIATWWIVGIPMVVGVAQLLSLSVELIFASFVVSAVLAMASLWLCARIILPREYPLATFKGRWSPELKTVGQRRIFLASN